METGSDILRKPVRRAFDPSRNAKVVASLGINGASDKMLQARLRYIYGFMGSRLSRLSRKTKITFCVMGGVCFFLLIIMLFVSGHKNSEAGILPYGVPSVMQDPMRVLLMTKLEEYIHDLDDYKRLIGLEKNLRTTDKKMEPADQIQLSRMEDTIRVLKTSYEAYIDSRLKDGALGLDTFNPVNIPLADKVIQEKIQVMARQGEIDLNTVLGKGTAKYPDSVLPADLAAMLEGRQITTDSGYNLTIPNTHVSVQSKGESVTVYLPTALVKKPFEEIKQQAVRQSLREYKSLYEQGLLTPAKRYEMAYAIGEYLSLMEQDQQWNAEDFSINPAFKSRWRTPDDRILLRWIKALQEEKGILTLAPSVRVAKLTLI
jgi:hypothetical protein